MKKLFLLSFYLVAVMGLAANNDDTPLGQSQQEGKDSIRFLTAAIQQCSLEVKQLSSLVLIQQEEIANSRVQSLQTTQIVDSLTRVLSTMRQDQLRYYRQAKDELAAIETVSKEMKNELTRNQRRLLLAMLASVSAALLLCLFFFVLLKNNRSLLKRNEDSELLPENDPGQGSTIGTSWPSQERDHSLALKIADEVMRIENNLSHMDSSAKGYKQLTKAVERIKQNFHANGYEIANLLGQHYDDGMKVTADFVLDDTLAPGEQLITNVIKPLVIYEGKMIQSAQVVVSQNI